MVSKHCFAAPDAHTVSAVLDELALVEKRVEFMIRTRPKPTRSQRDEMVLETANTILTICIRFVPFRPEQNPKPHRQHSCLAVHPRENGRVRWRQEGGVLPPRGVFLAPRAS
jgi:hypothetical protein